MFRQPRPLGLEPERDRLRPRCLALRGGDEADRSRLIDGLAHFGIGYSWGGFESLAVPADPQRVRSAAPWRAKGPLIRLHIGLEDADDLIEDLAAGLGRYRDPQ